MSVSKFYGVDLNHMSKRCCRVCERPSDQPKGQICTTCSAVIRAAHHHKVQLPIPFATIVLMLGAMGRDVGNFIDAMFATLDEVDANAWNSAVCRLPGPFSTGERVGDYSRF